MSYTALQNPEFDRQVSLRDAYKLMERFVSDYISRGDTSTTDFLYSYASTLASGETADPAALDDFLAAASSVLVGTEPSSD